MVSPLATPADFINASFEHVMRDVAGLPTRRLAALRQTYLVAHQAGDPRQELKAFREARGSTLLAWRSFSTWHEVFRQSNQFPYMWRRAGIGGDGKPPAADLQETMVELMAHTVTMTAYRCRDFHRMGQHLAEKGWRLAGAGDQIEDTIAAARLATVRLDDWRTWPPFFPGDRTSLKTAR